MGILGEKNRRKECESKVVMIRGITWRRRKEKVATMKSIWSEPILKENSTEEFRGNQPRTRLGSDFGISGALQHSLATGFALQIKP